MNEEQLESKKYLERVLKRIKEYEGEVIESRDNLGFLRTLGELKLSYFFHPYMRRYSVEFKGVEVPLIPSHAEEAFFLRTDKQIEENHLREQKRNERVAKVLEEL